MIESSSNDFGKAVLKGFKWGLIAGGTLWLFIVTLLIIGDPDSSVDSDFWAFILGFPIVGLGLGISGALSAGIWVGVARCFTFIGGTLLNLFTIITEVANSTVIGVVSFVLIPILLGVKTYLKNNASEWINQKDINKIINEALIHFLTSVLIILLKLFFGKITGISLS